MLLPTGCCSKEVMVTVLSDLKCMTFRVSLEGFELPKVFGNGYRGDESPFPELTDGCSRMIACAFSERSARSSGAPKGAFGNLIATGSRVGAAGVLSLDGCGVQLHITGSGKTVVPSEGSIRRAVEGAIGWEGLGLGYWWLGTGFTADLFSGLVAYLVDSSWSRPSWPEGLIRYTRCMR